MGCLQISRPEFVLSRIWDRGGEPLSAIGIDYLMPTILGVWKRRSSRRVLCQPRLCLCAFLKDQSLEIEGAGLTGNASFGKSVPPECFSDIAWLK